MKNRNSFQSIGSLGIAIMNALERKRRVEAKSPWQPVKLTQEDIVATEAAEYEQRRFDTKEGF